MPILDYYTEKIYRKIKQAIGKYKMATIMPNVKKSTKSN